MSNRDTAARPPPWTGSRARTYTFPELRRRRRAIGAFERLWIWKDAAVAGRLGRYLEVAENRAPAKFLVAAGVPARVSLKEAGEDELWAELDRLTPELLARRARRQAPGPVPEGPSLLELCRELAMRMLAHCNFCAWDCRVDRTIGTKFGACKLARGSRVSTYFHHLGEELIYRGQAGSGTIFFTSCNMRCAFCQNGDISTDKDNGQAVDSRTLAAMAWILRLEGCHNINWVGGDPTIHLHTIVDAIVLLGQGFSPTREDAARALPAKADRVFSFELDPGAGTWEGAFNVPMLWNSNFFMTGDTMRILRLLMDVWLPDFKFGPGRCAITLARTPRYWETVTANLALIHGWGEDFTIRHLVMPGHVECCTYPILDWIAAAMPDVPINIMDQYRPEIHTDPKSPKYMERYADMARRPTPREVRGYYHYARN
ncbi:MAG: pyruvate formate lyase activating enzyme, partial [Proteobacteria bacterium]|nr:pyruvate formate lyase activating enzyme [Pseudomonadota bacterium]